MYGFPLVSLYPPQALMHMISSAPVESHGEKMTSCQVTISPNPLVVMDKGSSLATRIGLRMLRAPVRYCSALSVTQDMQQISENAVVS